MEQGQFQVRFSLRTKLLTGLLLLLLVITVFLDTSAIELLTKDKTAYVFQLQTTETILATKNFTHLIQSALQTLRIILSSFSPKKPLSKKDFIHIQSILENQNTLVSLSFFKIKDKNKIFKTNHFIQKKNKSLISFYSKTFHAIEIFLSKNLKMIQKRHLFFLNLSQENVPMLGVLFSEKPDAPLLSLAWIRMNSFPKELSSSELSIVNAQGYLLFQSDPSKRSEKISFEKDPLFKKAQHTPTESGSFKFQKNGKQFLGSFRKTPFGPFVLTSINYRKIMSSIYTLAEKFIFIALIALGIGIIFALFFSKKITTPLKKLSLATRQVSQGNFKVQLKPPSRDELGALTQAFMMMSQKIEALIQVQIEKTHMEHELEIASTVQKTLIPPDFFETKDLSLHSFYQPADQCGGDWWGFFGIEDRLALFMADATGHGLPSALITAAARSCMSVLAKLAQEMPSFSYSPSALLHYANRAIFDSAKGKIMMTCFAGVFDFKESKLTYASAGHNPPWLLPNTSTKPVLKSLVAKGGRLGEKRDSSVYQEKTTSFSPKDLFFFYTDGLLENENPAGELFGKKRVRALLEEHAQKDPKFILKQIQETFSNYKAGTALQDDVTIAIAKIKEKS